MRPLFLVAGPLLTLGMCWPGSAPAGKEKAPTERGKEALLGRSFSPPIISRADYEKVWRVWGLKERPDDFNERVRERYGLHEAPYPNGGLPMGLREAKGLFGKGVGNDCMLCHAGRVAGQTVLGLGNNALDLQGLFDEFGEAQGLKQAVPVAFSRARGTSEATASSVYLFQFRNPDLSLRQLVKMDISDSACEDVPAWWLMKRKKTMYHTGSHSARSVRSLMVFMLTPLNTGAYIKSQEAAFRDIKAYLLSLEPPKYPFPVDEKKASAGKKLFTQHCARCHGTYGPGGSYPNKVVDLDVIGTDPELASAYGPETAETYNQTWFGEEKDADGKPLKAALNRGYQAPPLDGVWATAPYFHNASVPTVYHVLNSKARPKLFTRSFGTEKADYDPGKLGLKFMPLDKAPGPKAPPIERRKVYDTTQRGRSNAGHPFGDKLTDPERRAVIEYLKTL
jgi:mono/diheme cytochrome c family protein